MLVFRRGSFNRSLLIQITKMNDVSLRTIAAHGSARAIKDIWLDDPFITRLRNFVDLTLPDLQNLRAVIETELTVKKRRDLVLDGYEFNKLCFVKGGFAARYKLLRNGKRQIVNFVLPGDVVGLPGSFLDRAACSVIAVTDMELQVCSLDAFVGLCYRRAEIRSGTELARRAGSGRLRRARHQYRSSHADGTAGAFPARNPLPAGSWSGAANNSPSTCRSRRK